MATVSAWSEKRKKNVQCPNSSLSVSAQMYGRLLVQQQEAVTKDCIDFVQSVVKMVQMHICILSISAERCLSSLVLCEISLMYSWVTWYKETATGEIIRFATRRWTFGYFHPSPTHFAFVIKSYASELQSLFYSDIFDLDHSKYLSISSVRTAIFVLFKHKIQSFLRMFCLKCRFLLFRNNLPIKIKDNNKNKQNLPCM